MQSTVSMYKYINNTDLILKQNPPKNDVINIKTGAESVLCENLRFFISLIR